MNDYAKDLQQMGEQLGIEENSHFGNVIRNAAQEIERLECVERAFLNDGEWLREVTRFGDTERRYVIEPGALDPKARKAV